MSYDEPAWLEPPRGQQTQGRGKGRFQKPDNDRGDYVEVDKRIQEFYAKYPDGRLTSRIHKLSRIDAIEWFDKKTDRGPKPTPRLVGVIVVEAFAFRTPEDQHPGVGHSWMLMPGQTPYTFGSELENAETSAWGRAIAAVGLATRGGIATADEVRSKSSDDETTGSVPAADTPTDAPAPAPAKEDTTTALPEDPVATVPRSLEQTPDEEIAAMTAPVFLQLCRERFIQSATISKTARALFGDDVESVKALTNEQRQQLWHALSTGEVTGSPEPSEASTPSS